MLLALAKLQEEHIHQPINYETQVSRKKKVLLVLKLSDFTGCFILEKNCLENEKGCRG